ncbi:hypothetical protein ABBQ38_009422 [Trebouxia sp. C0009 RCD-2024]
MYAAYLHMMPRTASQHLSFLRRVLDCAPISSLRASQVFSLSRRHYQTGLQEVEPWPHAKSAIEEAETPPSSWYTSPAVLQAELATVFQNSWLWMGEASKLQQPGDFITSLVTDRPFVACIDQQGQLKAYHNVCRHHAAAVCDDAHGNTQQFACPYHGWVYGLDGRLQKASKLKGIKNFKASEMGLLPVSADTWGGFAFIQAGKDRAMSLKDWLGSGGDAMQRAGISLTGMRHVHSRTYHLHCNWKVFCDNYLVRMAATMCPLLIRSWPWACRWTPTPVACMNACPYSLVDPKEPVSRPLTSAWGVSLLPMPLCTPT